MKSLINNSTNFFPLSFEQEQFLSKEEVKCVNEFNNISAMTRLIGQVQIPEMLAALNEIVRRHEIFRTTFNISDQFLVQTIAAQSFNHFLIHALKIMIYLTFNCFIGF